VDAVLNRMLFILIWLAIISFAILLLGFVWGQSGLFAEMYQSIPRWFGYLLMVVMVSSLFLVYVLGAKYKDGRFVWKNAK